VSGNRFRISEAAALLGVSDDMIRRWATAGPEPFRAATSPERTARLRTGDRVTVEIPPDTIQVTPVRS